MKRGWCITAAAREHRPNPIVQMGLFMDYEGIPPVFCINPGNTNEQVTLQPLEQKLMDDFKLSKFTCFISLPIYRLLEKS